MYNKNIIKLIVKDWFKLKTGFKLSNETIVKMVDDIMETKQSTIADIISWVSVKNELPDKLETVWISNGKGFTTLGCIVYAEDGWHWAQTNGVIYQKKGKIVSECESDDLDVKFWHRLPEPPCL